MQDTLSVGNRSASFASHAAAFMRGETSPSQLLEDCLTRMVLMEPQVRSFASVDAQRARADAHGSTRRWAQGKPLSPIDGMAFGAKDIFESVGMPTGLGSPIWSGYETRRDAATVHALREAGAVIVGKCTTTEFASTELLASTTNPRDAARTPGGSSSGSAAAVGAGFVPITLGSQVVGSTLRPASYCGCIGFKPTFGALNRGGSFDHLSHSCIGILGATLEDVWLTAKQIADRVGGDPGHLPLQGPDAYVEAEMPRRLLVLDTAGWSLAGNGAKAAFLALLDKLRGAGVQLVTRRDLAQLERFEDMLAADLLELSARILAWESRWPYASYAATASSQVSRAILQRLDKGRRMLPSDYAEALERRTSLRFAYDGLLRGFDGAVTLAATGAAPVGFANTGRPEFNIPASLLGAPALSLPLLSDGSLPLGLQLIGAPGKDAALFGHARWIMERTAAAEIDRN